MSMSHTVFGGLALATASIVGVTSTTQSQQATSPVLQCAPYIEDAATAGNCLTASSAPTLGSLYPLSQNLFVSPLGNLGVGTLNPLARLDVVGDTRVDGTLHWNSGSSELQRAQGGSIELGSFNHNAETPFIDFHYGVAGQAQDYNVRVINNGNRRLAITDGLAAVQIDGGRIGLGTSYPTALLDVQGEAVTNTLRIRGGGDVVERFTTTGETLEPGTVVALDASSPGAVTESSTSYDNKVIGVVSGAGGVRPGIELTQIDVLDGEVQVAMVGRVYVKCSAENGPILPGDRLTTASLRGHAMKASNRDLADGAVIGKAAGTLVEGTGLVLVVVNLQ